VGQVATAFRGWVTGGVGVEVWVVVAVSDRGLGVCGGVGGGGGVGRSYLRQEVGGGSS